MASAPPSWRSRISHSTPKGTPSPRPPTTNTTARSIPERSNRSSYTDTFQGSSSASRSASAAVKSVDEPRPDHNETGESTRSLLSVLSHSSVDSLSTGSNSNNSRKSSPDRSNSRPQSGNPVNETRVIVNGHEGQEEEHGELSPWEEWLIEKSKLEREKIREEAQQHRDKIRAQKAEEERNREKRRLVEARVLDWLREKEGEERKRKAAEREKKRRERTERSAVKQKNAEKDKAKREEWLAQKLERERKERERSEKEKRERALEERLRKEKAEEAFKKWKKEARSRPRPPSGGFCGKGHTGDSSYPVPAFVNPVPWRPIETSTPLSNTRQKKGSARKKKSAQDLTDAVIESPPLLFRDRSRKENMRPRGGPR